MSEHDLAIRTDDGDASVWVTVTPALGDDAKANEVADRVADLISEEFGDRVSTNSYE